MWFVRSDFFPQNVLWEAEKESNCTVEKAGMTLAMCSRLNQEWWVVLVACTLDVGASLVVQLVKNAPAMQETWVRSLGGEDPLGKGVEAHSSTPVWRIPRTEEPGRLQSLGPHRVRHA